MALDNKTKRLVITLLGLGGLIQLLAGIVHGIHAEWFRFGLSLTGCLITTIFFTGVFLAYKIDSRFNRLEKYIGQRYQNKEKEEKDMEKDIDKSS